ncbi:MAG: alpha/beta hydrolase, partial [Phycisphaerae bacterium]|nr:alpha/beta hydrolase [Phycisphaerae bacterium]
MESHHDSARWRSRLYALLGDLPPRHRPIMVTLTQQRETAYGTLEALSLDLNGEEPVPAYFLRPNGPAGARPTILYNHAHGGQYDIGKSELIRPRDGLQEPPYGETLVKPGYNVLCIDAWGFGERHTRSESELFKEMLWRGQVLWGMMVYDSIRA